MTQVTLVYDVQKKEVDNLLNHLLTVLNPVGMALFLKMAGVPYVQRRVGARFASEGDDVTGPWAQLRPSTVNLRQSLGFPGEHPINVRTGRLERWISGDPGDAHPTVFGATLIYPGKQPTGELKEKFTVAQQGDSTHVRGAPPRPVLGLNSRDLLFMLSALQAYVRTGKP